MTTELEPSREAVGDGIYVYLGYLTPRNNIAITKLDNLGSGVWHATATVGGKTRHFVYSTSSNRVVRESRR